MVLSLVIYFTLMICIIHIKDLISTIGTKLNFTIKIKPNDIIFIIYLIQMVLSLIFIQ